MSDNSTDPIIDPSEAYRIALKSAIALTMEAYDLRENHGGMWGAHPDHPVADWKYEVLNDGTRLSYWAWVALEIEIEAASPDEPDDDELFHEAARRDQLSGEIGGDD